MDREVVVVDNHDRGHGQFCLSPSLFPCPWLDLLGKEERNGGEDSHRSGSSEEEEKV